MSATDAPEELLREAEKVRQALRLGVRRAFVLEFTGTPKAGKTSVLATLQAFFKSAGFKVSVLKERAAECPLAMKGHFFFNAWTMSTMLAEVLASLETDADLLLLDRGFLDALIWLELQSARQQVSDDEKDTFTKFVLLPRWRSLIDYTIIMKTRPEVAVQRENQALLVPRKGTLMNEPALAAFNEAMARVELAQRENFQFLEIDTSDTQSARESCIQVLHATLPVLYAWANPKVTVIRRADLDRVFQSHLFLDKDEAAEGLARLSQLAFLMPRVEAEKDPEFLQLVVGGIPLRANGDILVFRRDPADEKSTSYGRMTIWKGCHVQIEPASLTGAGLSEALVKRLHEGLHIKTSLSPELIGIAAPMPNEGSSDKLRLRHRHIGILHRVVLPDAVAETLHEKEFRRSGRIHPFSGDFRTQVQIIEQLEQPLDDLRLEPWSKYLIKNVRIDA